MNHSTPISTISTPAIYSASCFVSDNQCRELVLYRGNVYHDQSKVQEENHKLDAPLAKIVNIYGLFYKTSIESVPSSINFPFLLSPSVFKEAFDAVPECPAEHESIYLGTNEDKQAKTIAIMRREKLVGNTILAVSGFFGLNLAAARAESQGQQLDYIIMIDRSQRTEKLWKIVQEIVQKHVLREDALAALKAVLLKTPSDFWRFEYRMPNDLMKLESDINSGNSWLSTQAKYAKIRNIFNQGHFIFKRLDLFNSLSVRALSQAISKLNLTLDTVYLSNVREYAEGESALSRFQASVQELLPIITQQTLVIDTKPRINGLQGSEILVQRVIRKIVQSNLVSAFPPSPHAQSHCNCPFHAKQGHAHSIAIPITLLFSLMRAENFTDVSFFFDD
jgi:hypothetical protein